MKNITEYVKEGLFDAFKAQKQITKAQAAVFKYYEENASKYDNDDKKMAADLQKVAQKAYNDNCDEKICMSFNDWFKDFEKSINYAWEKQKENK